MVPAWRLTPDGRSRLLQQWGADTHTRGYDGDDGGGGGEGDMSWTYESMSTFSWLAVDGEGLGSSPGPITLILTFR